MLTANEMRFVLTAKIVNWCQARVLQYSGLLVSFFMLTFSPAQADERVALVIGNSAYEHVPGLPNPKNDAEAISDALERLDFKVIRGIDLDHAGFVAKIKEYTRAIRGANIALLYYAGHGLQVRGENYLAPIDTELFDEADLEFETIRLEAIMSQMERERRTNLVFLDACRDNPLTLNLAQTMGTRSLGPDRGLAPVETGVGTLVAYSTQPGNVAYDGTGKHSPFTGALLEHLEAPGDDIAVILRKVRQKVLQETDGRQVPWSNSSLTGPVVLRAAEIDPIIEQRKFDLAYWESVQGSEDLSFFKNYLERFPLGQFADLAKLKIASIRKKENEREDLLQELQEKSRRQASALEELEAERQRLLEERNQDAERQAAALAAANEEAKRREEQIALLNREKALLEEEAQAALALQENTLEAARKDAADQLKQLVRLEQEKAELAQQSQELSEAQKKTLAEAIVLSQENAAEVERLKVEKARLQTETENLAAANRAALESAEKEAKANTAMIAKLEGQTVIPQDQKPVAASTPDRTVGSDLEGLLNRDDALYSQVEDLEAAIKARELEAKRLIEKLEEARKARSVVDMDVAMLPGSSMDLIKEHQTASNKDPFGDYNLTIEQDDPDYGLAGRDLARRLQEELNRAGCKAGTVDGIWGKKSRTALRKLFNVKGLKISSLRPDSQLLALARQHPENSCRLTCKDGFAERDGACVRSNQKRVTCSSAAGSFSCVY